MWLYSLYDEGNEGVRGSLSREVKRRSRSLKSKFDSTSEKTGDWSLSSEVLKQIYSVKEMFRRGPYQADANVPSQ